MQTRPSALTGRTYDFSFFFPTVGFLVLHKSRQRGMRSVYVRHRTHWGAGIATRTPKDYSLLLINQ